MHNFYIRLFELCKQCRLKQTQKLNKEQIQPVTITERYLSSTIISQMRSRSHVQYCFTPSRSPFASTQAFSVVLIDESSFRYVQMHSHKLVCYLLGFVCRCAVREKLLRIGSMKRIQCTLQCVSYNFHVVCFLRMNCSQKLPFDKCICFTVIGENLKYLFPMNLNPTGNDRRTTEVSDNQNETTKKCLVSRSR